MHYPSFTVHSLHPKQELTKTWTENKGHRQAKAGWWSSCSPTSSNASTSAANENYLEQHSSPPWAFLSIACAHTPPVTILCYFSFRPFLACLHLPAACCGTALLQVTSFCEREPQGLYYCKESPAWFSTGMRSSRRQLCLGSGSWQPSGKTRSAKSFESRSFIQTKITIASFQMAKGHLCSALTSRPISNPILRSALSPVRAELSWQASKSESSLGDCVLPSHPTPSPRLKHLSSCAIVPGCPLASAVSTAADSIVAGGYN